MKIEQLPSGSYRIRKTYNKKTYTITLDYKPTQKEALQLMAAELDKVKIKGTNKTFEVIAKDYIKSKSNILSPSTIRGYEAILKKMPEYFKEMRASDIENSTIQILANEYSITHSQKTVKNVVAFISAVISLYNPNLRVKVTLPQKVKREEYIPTDEDVKRILEHSKGTMYECALMLATMGLRRSEIVAITSDDLDGNILTINKALVFDSNCNYVLKTTKTEDSTRKLYLPDNIAAFIRKQNGKIYPGHPNNILWFLYKAQDELGIQRFSLHKFRHYFATKLSYMPNINEEDILKMGGWKTSHVMKEVYRHSQIDRNIQTQKDIASQISNDLFS